MEIEESILYLSLAEAKEICGAVLSDLHTAAEDDGIGMESDSEWIYLQIAEEIESYLEG